MYREILVPTGSDPSRKRVIENAVDLADTYGARIHVLHVADLVDRGHLSDEDELDPEDEARGEIEAVEEAAEAAGVETRSEVREGTPYEEILDYVDAEGIDIVVMGTHGKSGLSRMLLGSTAEEVLRRSPVPVLTVKG